MPRSTQKTVVLISAFLVCCAAIILAAVAFGTQYWITQTYVTNSIMGKQDLTIHTGLFKVYVHVPSTDPTTFTMKECYNQYPEFMNFGVWVCTILFLILGIVFGAVSAVFTAVNSATTPIEEITGVTGLYLWNGLACLFSLAAVLFWVGQYCSHLDDILQSIKAIDSWSSDYINSNEPSSMGYSFYLVCGTAFLYLINMGLVYLSRVNLGKSKDSIASVIEEPTDGMIMLY